MIKNEQKNKLRKQILAKRNQLSEEYKNHAAEEILCKLRSHVCYQRATDLCLYVPIRNEVDLFQYAECFREDGKRLYLPRVDGNTMDFYLYQPDTALVEGAYHILEPAGDIPFKPDPADSCLIVMPGAVFSKKMDRIGYGGGYYDRYLAKYPECITVAIAYAEQIVPEFDFPMEETDIQPDYLFYNHS